MTSFDNAWRISLSLSVYRFAEPESTEDDHTQWRHTHAGWAMTLHTENALEDQHTRELSSAPKTSHKYDNKGLSHLQ